MGRKNWKIIKDLDFLQSCPSRKKRYTMNLSLAAQVQFACWKLLGLQTACQALNIGMTSPYVGIYQLFTFVPFAAKAWPITNWVLQSCEDWLLGNIYVRFLYPDGTCQDNKIRIFISQDCLHLDRNWGLFEGKRELPAAHSQRREQKPSDLYCCYLLPKLTKQSPPFVKTVCIVMMSTYQEGFKTFHLSRTTPSIPGFPALELIGRYQ